MVITEEIHSNSFLDPRTRLDNHFNFDLRSVLACPLVISLAHAQKCVIVIDLVLART